MISPPRQHVSGSSKVISASAAIANLLHRARMPCILEYPRDSRFVGRAKIQSFCGKALRGPGFGGFLHFRITVQKANVVSRWKRGHRISCKCAGTGGHCSVTRQHIVTQRRPHHAHSFVLHVTTLGLAVYLSRLPMNARRFQRPQPLSGVGEYSLKASKDIGMGVAALACGSEPLVDAVCAAMVVSARTGRVLNAGSAGTDLPTYATLATHGCRSLKKG